MHALVSHDDDAGAHVAGDTRQKDDAVDGHQRHRLADAAVPSSQVQLQIRVHVHRSRVSGGVCRFRFVRGRHAAHSRRLTARRFTRSSLMTTMLKSYHTCEVCTSVKSS